MAREQDLTQNRPSIVDLCAATVADEEQGTMMAKSNDFSVCAVLRMYIVRAQPWRLPFFGHQTWSYHGLTIPHSLATHQDTHASFQFRLSGR